MRKSPEPRPDDSPLKILGDVRTSRFLAHYWQQQPLLARQVFPRDSGFAPLSNKEILQLATYDEAESRLVVNDGKQWTMEHGPFPAGKFSALKKVPGASWAVLVQDTQHFSYEAHDLLRRFSFLPYSRIDDLMVSYASKGGGVGPHFDSYDVFLLQGSGRRRWQISAQTDRTLRADAPLKILKNFKSEQEWTLEEGDMLYLPPGFAHHGIAESDHCVTWSIGFRAPTYQELVDAYLDHLRDNLTIAGRYADDRRKAVTQPSFIDAALRGNWSAKLAAAIGDALTPDKIHAFAGHYLTQPKSHVEFNPPDHTATRSAFRRAACRHGIRLDLRSRMMFDATHFYLNGRAIVAGAILNSKQRSNLAQLANHRTIAPTDLDADLPSLLYEPWTNGELELWRSNT